jgi:hypothetical protein
MSSHFCRLAAISSIIRYLYINIKLCYPYHYNWFHNILLHGIAVQQYLLNNPINNAFRCFNILTGIIFFPDYCFNFFIMFLANIGIL